MQYRCLGLTDGMSTDSLLGGVEAFASRTENRVQLELLERREDLIYSIRAGGYDAVVVALPGALGMEAVLGVRLLDPAVPLIWISEDEVFALESYRQRVNMFLRAPATTEQVAGALARCFPT
ncbi:MAG: hypothetical protein RRY95_01045 [Oscillospiraceae bacterium]